ncbi:unnamed protein product [Psylliodes chrysocephalus]|uniref:Phorbol-ester/DAG-type domain-containing protein n=1 Tax=Psylliodes chrysocephalus TaxID=3402493 RepID=A0A9P0D1M0_9CUCU|nr:unnamed protein product [Psylliodes chrysocephala]
MPDTKSVSGCKRCKKVTTSGLKCIVCGIVSHPSCLNSIKNAKKIDENSCNCCGEINESACAIADISTDNLLEKLKHFEELVISKNQTIQYQEIAIKSLQDQVGLLQKSLCSVSIQYPKKISTASDAREDDNSLSSHEVNKVFTPINTPNQTSLITAQNASRAIENAQTSNIFNKLIHINSESASSSKRVVSTTQRASRNLFTGNMSACNNLQLKASVKPINPDMKLLHSIYWDPDTDTDELMLFALISYLKKKEILSNCTNLRGTSIKTVEDLIEEDRKEKRILLENLKIARNGNKKAYIEGLKLFIGEVPYTASELINLEPEFNFSPPPQQKAASEPSTPSPKETEDPVYEEKRITEETKSQTETKKGEKNKIKETKPIREFRLRSDGATIHSKSTKTASDLIKKPVKKYNY